LLELKGVEVFSGDRQILKGLDLEVGFGELHVVMGPNGSGKSTLAHAVMGNPAYTLKSGAILFKGEDISGLSPDERARRGIFLAFQKPREVPGVPMHHFLRVAMSARRGAPVSAVEARVELLEWAELLKIEEDLVGRNLNEGFSGGERKRSELLQMMALKPDLAILDEIDTGMDVEGTRAIVAAINELREVSPDSSFVIISHYPTALEGISVDAVHVIVEGVVVAEGGRELAERIERSGYEDFIDSYIAAS
jgi:Fe-S cluster assembly ATP-binding protein